MSKPITTETLAHCLPDGVIIKHVRREKDYVYNVSDPNGDWQAAVEIDDDDDVTTERIVRAAWVQEHHLRALLLQLEARQEFNALLRGLHELHEHNRDVDIEQAVRGLKAGADT